MPILQDDIKLLKPQVLLGTSDGGGANLKVTNSGRFFVVGLRVPVVTAGQTIQGFVNIEGYGGRA